MKLQYETSVAAVSSCINCCQIWHAADYGKGTLVGLVENSLIKPRQRVKFTRQIDL